VGTKIKPRQENEGA